MYFDVHIFVCIIFFKWFLLYFVAVILLLKYICSPDLVVHCFCCYRFLCYYCCCSCCYCWHCGFHLLMLLIGSMLMKMISMGCSRTRSLSLSLVLALIGLSVCWIDGGGKRMVEIDGWLACWMDGHRLFRRLSCVVFWYLPMIKWPLWDIVSCVSGGEVLHWTNSLVALWGRLCPGCVCVRVCAHSPMFVCCECCYFRSPNVTTLAWSIFTSYGMLR